MKKLKAEDLFSLEYGDTIYLRQGSYMRTYRYVGRMPCSPEKYLILSDGENLKHIYISKDGEFKGEWYNGEYDEKFNIKLQIEDLEVELKALKEELNLKQ